MTTTTPPSNDSTNKLSLAEIKAALRRLRDEKTVEQRDEHAAHILSHRFLSEVERLTKERGITRKALAAEVGTSASYITQLFRGDCTLNLLMIARFERVLGTEFQVKALAPASKPIAHETHPAMLRKMPGSLRSHVFAQQQVHTGGQMQPYSTPVTLSPAIANIFS